MKIDNQEEKKMNEKCYPLRLDLLFNSLNLVPCQILILVFVTKKCTSSCK